MENSYETIIFFVVACIAYIIYKSRIHSFKKISSNEIDAPSNASDELNYSMEIESIKNKIAPRYINYNIYRITIEKNLPKELVDYIFKNSEIEYGRPSIHLPKKFFTDAGIHAVTDWLLQRGVRLKSDGTMSMELSDYFAKETRPQAEKIVEDAIAAIEKQKAG